MKVAKIVAIGIFAVFALALNANAYTWTGVYNESNKSHDTLQINESGWDSKNVSLANLFNQYFTDKLGAGNFDTYADSNALYADRGIKRQVGNWTLSANSEIIASFKSAQYGHELFAMNAETGEAESVFKVGKLLTNDPATSMLANTSYKIEANGEFNFELGTYNTYDHDQKYDTLYGDDPSRNSGETIQMVAIDVTDLIRKIEGYEDITSAFMFGWEDLPLNMSADYDYQDLVYIAINVTPDGYVTPEPATIAIFGLGALGLPFLRKRFVKKSK